MKPNVTSSKTSTLICGLASGTKGNKPATTNYVTILFTFTTNKPFSFCRITHKIEGNNSKEGFWHNPSVLILAEPRTSQSNTEHAAMKFFVIRHSNSSHFFPSNPGFLCLSLRQCIHCRKSDAISKSKFELHINHSTLISTGSSCSLFKQRFQKCRT